MELRDALRRRPVTAERRAAITEAVRQIVDAALAYRPIAL